MKYCGVECVQSQQVLHVRSQIQIREQFCVLLLLDKSNMATESLILEFLLLIHGRPGRNHLLGCALRAIHLDKHCLDFISLLQLLAANCRNKFKPLIIKIDDPSCALHPYNAMMHYV